MWRVCVFVCVCGCVGMDLIVPKNYNKGPDGYFLLAHVVFEDGFLLLVCLWPDLLFRNPLNVSESST